MPIELLLLAVIAAVALLLALPAGRRLLATAVDVIDASVGMYTIRELLGRDTTTARQRRIDRRQAREQAELERRIGVVPSVEEDGVSGATGPSFVPVRTTLAPTRIVVSGETSRAGAPAGREGAAPAAAGGDRPAPDDGAVIHRDRRLWDAAFATLGLAIVITAVVAVLPGPQGDVLDATGTPVPAATEDPAAGRASPEPVVAGPVRVPSAAPSGAPASSATPSPSAVESPSSPPAAIGPSLDRRLLGGTANGSTVRVRVTWELAVGPSVSGFEILVKVADGAFEPVDRVDAESRSADVRLPIGETSTIRVAAFGPNGVVPDETVVDGAAAELPPIRVSRYQESSERVTLQGVWRRAAGPSLLGGGVIFSRGTGRLSLRFTGTDVAWVATKTPMSGRAEVRVDGKVIDTVDLRSDSVDYRRVVFRWQGDPGDHTLEIRALGDGRVDADAFLVLR